MDYFTQEKLTEHITRITCPGYVYAFLVTGRRRALLIDAGYGMGSIRKYVESLTDLPITVVLTHGHFDHSGGTVEFGEAYIADEDAHVLKRDINFNKRVSYICDMFGFPREDLLPEKEVKALSLKPFDTFDLGDYHVKAIPLPGHTRGFMCMLFEEDRKILVGDGLNSYCMLVFEESTSVAEYYEALKDFKEFEKEFDEVLFSHTGNFGGKEITDEMIELCEGVISGTIKGIPQKLEEREGDFFITCERNDRGRRLDGKAANLLYEHV